MLAMNKKNYTLRTFFLAHLKNKKRYIVGFAIISVVWAIEMTLSPYLLKLIVNAVDYNAANNKAMLHACIMPIAVYIIVSIVLNFNFRFHEYLNIKLYPQLKTQIISSMFAHILSYPVDYFYKNKGGSVAKKIFDMAENIEVIIDIINEWILARFVAILFASIMLFFVVGPMFSLILIVWAILYTIISFKAAKSTANLSKSFAKDLNEVEGFVVDSIANIGNTKIFSAEKCEVDTLQGTMKNLKHSDTLLQKQNLKIQFIQNTSVTAFIGSMLITLIYQRYYGDVSIGDFALVLTLSLSFIVAIYNMGQQILKLSKAIGICKQALTLMNQSYNYPNESSKSICITNGKIEFSKVYFSYEGKLNVLTDFNLTILPKQKIGLVGLSGAGKSTLFKLLLGLIYVDSGVISIDEQDLQQVAGKTLRDQIAMIPQTPNFYHRSIKDNIRIAKPEASDDEVILAAKAALCHEFIMDFEAGYETLVGENGVKLSGGQKQRLSIARAFLRNTPVLLLDEMTSNLDAITEEQIQVSLERIIQDKTVLVIAHRLSTLRQMDRILVLEKGVIIEDDTFDNLMEREDSVFKRLWQVQYGEEI